VIEQACRVRPSPDQVALGTREFVRVLTRAAAFRPGCKDDWSLLAGELGHLLSGFAGHVSHTAGCEDHTVVPGLSNEAKLASII
jgi:hypothetical protein